MGYIRRVLTGLLGVCVVAGVTGFTASLDAQEWGPGSARSPDSILVQLQDSSGNVRNLGAIRARRLFEERPQAEVDALVNGLVQLADSDVAASRSEAVRALLAWARTDRVRGTARVTRTLVEVYQRLPVEGAKGLILQRLPELDMGPEAVGFLRRIALDEDPEASFFPSLALEGLAHMGAPGRAMLRDSSVR